MICQVVPCATGWAVCLAFAAALRRFGVPAEVLSDIQRDRQSAFHWHLLDRAIRPRYIKLTTLRLNGKVECRRRIDAEEVYRMLDGVMIDDTKLFNDKLAEWENFCKYHRPTAAPAARAI